MPSPITLANLQQKRALGEPIAMLTCYDASFAHLSAAAGVDVLLVGDSLGMVIQGHTSTLPVTLADMVYHTRIVAQGAEQAMVLADLPFGSYQASPEQAFASAAALMMAGAHMVKLEGGALMAPTVDFLTARGIPVCAHIGLTPQSVNQLSGYKVQGKTDLAASQLLADARILESSGAAMVVLEAIPASLAAQISAASQTLLTIGIGAGADCHGQVLVVYDILGIYPGKKPRFVQNFMTGQADIPSALSAYVAAVKNRSFPTPLQSF